MSKNATGVDQNREDEDGRISPDTATSTAGTNQADNRILLFRAWFPSECWQDGIARMQEDVCISGTGGVMGLEGGWDYYGDEDRAIPMQCTGLYDKKGKWIFEGDIVAIDMWQGNEHGYIPEDGVVKWHQPSAAFKWFSMEEDPSDEHNYWLSQADDKGREVIGNIYENPELMVQLSQRLSKTGAKDE